MKDDLRPIARRASRENIDHPLPGNVWLTAEQIAAADVLGTGKTVNAVRMYIKRHKLSDHPTWCRKTPGAGRALKYNLLLFTQRDMAIRKIGRAAKESHPPRETAALVTGEAGELHREICAHFAMGRGPHEAEFVRNRCLDRFGTTIMKASDPADRIKMPPLRAFQKVMRQLSTSRLAPDVDVRRLMEISGLRGKTKDELIGLIEHHKKQRKQLRDEIMTVIKGAEATRDPDALRRRIDRIKRLVTGLEGF